MLELIETARELASGTPYKPRQADLRIVKRVAAVIESRAEGLLLVLASDNAGAGADSRVFGPVAMKLVLGRVISRLR